MERVEHPRSVAKVIEAQSFLEGDGFQVHRPFPTREVSHLDPFLLLDEMGPSELGPGEAKGASDHPHRGFETVTYMLSGEFEHRDSEGNHGLIGPGDVQWMTAGAGVIHSEMPSQKLLREGGRMHGVQLWVNLPRKDKMTAPRYQDVSRASIPVFDSPDGKAKVRVISTLPGTAPSPVDTKIPILYLHYTLQPGAEIREKLPADLAAFAYVLEGEGKFDEASDPVGRSKLALFSRLGDGILIRNSGKGPLDFLLLGGKPIGEPVARYGPFVMNDAEEIRQAIEDFRNDRLTKRGR